MVGGLFIFINFLDIFGLVSTFYFFNLFAQEFPILNYLFKFLIKKILLSKILILILLLKIKEVIPHNYLPSHFIF